MSTKKMKFQLLNGLDENQVKSASYVVYLHQCTSGCYVGWSSDPVKRWEIHCIDSRNPSGDYYNDSLKVAIRRHGTAFQHYILGVANSEHIAKSKEAYAIAFYDCALNERREKLEGKTYPFRKIDDQLGKPVFLSRKSAKGATVSRKDKDREWVEVEIVRQGSTKGVRCSKGKYVGLMVQCDEEQREDFSIGDQAKIKVACSERKGKPFLVAAKGPGTLVNLD